jgi:hypothetical protein
LLLYFHLILNNYFSIIFIRFTFLKFNNFLQATFLFMLSHLLLTISSLYIFVSEHFNNSPSVTYVTAGRNQLLVS